MNKNEFFLFLSRTQPVLCFARNEQMLQTKWVIGQCVHCPSKMVLFNCDGYNVYTLSRLSRYASLTWAM